MANDVEDQLSRLRGLLARAHARANNVVAEVLSLPEEDRIEDHFNPDEGEVEGHQQEDHDLVFVESYRNVTSVPRKFKRGRKRPRPLANVEIIVVHQTAVAGGFGTSARLLARFDGDGAAARQARYQAIPYHGIYSPRDKASIVQWPPWVLTYHGHGGNARGVGWAYDGELPGDQLDVLGARIALRHFVSAMRDAGAKNLRYIEGHRQHSNQRGGDPGVEIWGQVVIPLLDELELETRPERTTGTGKALPDDWMRGA